MNVCTHLHSRASMSKEPLPCAPLMQPLKDSSLNISAERDLEKQIEGALPLDDTFRKLFSSICSERKNAIAIQTFRILQLFTEFRAPEFGRSGH